MSIAVEFAAYVAKCSGLVASAMISCLAAASAGSGKDHGALVKPALSFLALFLVSLLVYLAI